jgi:hypothetical protein
VAMGLAQSWRAGLGRALLHRIRPGHFNRKIMGSAARIHPVVVPPPSSQRTYGLWRAVHAGGRGGGGLLRLPSAARRRSCCPADAEQAAKAPRGRARRGATPQWLVVSLQWTSPKSPFTHSEWGWRPLGQTVGQIGCCETATAAVPSPQHPFEAQSLSDWHGAPTLPPSPPSSRGPQAGNRSRAPPSTATTVLFMGSPSAPPHRRSEPILTGSWSRGSRHSTWSAACVSARTPSRRWA